MGGSLAPNGSVAVTPKLDPRRSGGASSSASTVRSGPDYRGCKNGALMDSFGIFLQGLLGVVAFSLLLRECSVRLRLSLSLSLLPESLLWSLAGRRLPAPLQLALQPSPPWGLFPVFWFCSQPPPAPRCPPLSCSFSEVVTRPSSLPFSWRPSRVSFLVLERPALRG